MYKRSIEDYITEIKEKYRAITLIGPRQSGKTTLAKNFFPHHQYISLENPDTRTRIEMDPRGFLKSLKQSTILDEVQKFPDLLSYLQEILDDKNDPRQFILTGSNSLLLSEKISQSLAGRSRILTILPLQKKELPPQEWPENLDAFMWKGLYPRVYDEKLHARDWFADYYATYIEKDVRNLLQVDNLALFDRFVRLIAGRVGQLVNYSSLSNDVGISQPTANSWMAVMQASYIMFTLQPHFKNFSKRLIKSSKIYFYDTGLLCYLLRIESPMQLETHPLRGQIFENWVLINFYKNYFNQGKEAPLYFWRDQHGHEVDLVIDKGASLDLIEIKSSQTFNPVFLKNLQWLGGVQNKLGGTVIYGGDESFSINEDYTLKSWRDLD